MKRFIIEAPPTRRAEIEASLASFRNRDSVVLVDRLDESTLALQGVEPNSRCLSLSGNLVFLKSQLNRVLRDVRLSSGTVVRVSTSDADRGGEIAAGPCAELFRASGLNLEPVRPPAGALPFALNGRPEDREEAELLLARALREETAATDAPMARWIDRKISWRLSLRLARTKITPNQVTIANTILGLACGWMFAMPGYWWRLTAAVLFMFSIMIDGVDGELARLQMSETEWGGKLDVVTDNIVHVAIFIGIFVGCYRASHSSVYFALMAMVLVGLGLCAFAIFRAISIEGDAGGEWLDRIERWSGRDFAYLLVGFAMFDRLQFFAWGTAFGTYAFAFIVMWLTARRGASAAQEDTRRAQRGIPAEEA